MCEPVSLTLAAAAVAAGGQIYSGMAANAQGKYEARVANENRKAELAARDDANRRGTIEQLRHYRQLSQRLGAQRAQMAGTGLDVNFGSPVDLLGDTEMLGWEDSQIIAENTAREARGYEINAANYTMQGRAAKARGKAALHGSFFQAGATLLGGASQAGQIQAQQGGAANFGSNRAAQAQVTNFSSWASRSGRFGP